MKFSFIIPTYEPDERLINECISSIINLKADTSQIEIIIILNGSKDPYYSMLEQLTDNKITRIFYTDQKGVSNARNLGLDSARGEYIIFVDDDDWICETFLNVNFLESNKSVVIVANLKSYIEEQDTFVNDYLGKSFLRLSQKKYDIINFRCFFSQVCGKIIPREIIGNVRFNQSLSISEDALFMFEISRRIENMYLDDNLVYFRRIRRNSVSNTSNSLFINFSNMISFTSKLSQVYFTTPLEYNFIFYITRILGSIKYFGIKVIKK